MDSKRPFQSNSVGSNSKLISFCFSNIWCTLKDSFIYINDMSNSVSSSINLFVDDSYVYRGINNTLEGKRSGQWNSTQANVTS